MDKVLVQFEKDWADEFNVYGFMVFDKLEWEYQVKGFLNAEEYVSFYFGTNEGWEEEDIKDSKRYWLEDYSVTPITSGEYGVLKKVFGFEIGDSVGVFPIPLDLVAYEEDEDEEDENEDEEYV